SSRPHQYRSSKLGLCLHPAQFSRALAESGELVFHQRLLPPLAVADLFNKDCRGGDMFYAHSTADKNRCIWQRLDEHLLGTSRLAEQFGEPIGIARAARLAGLLHDLGKYSRECQARLAGASERVDHSTA